MTTRRAKIVATLGPRTSEPETIAPLIDAGVDVFRLNLAHASLDVHERSATLARQLAAERQKTVGILVDLPGPKMRTGPVIDDLVVLETGAAFTLVSDEVVGDSSRVSSTVPNLAELVSRDDEVYLADGAIVLKVIGVEGGDVHTTVARRGVLRSRKGMHLPAAERNVRAFTEKDEAALEWAVSIKADFAGLSFIRDADDLERARTALPKRGLRPGLVAKIETRSALEHLEGIIETADAVMIARGDLGIQTALTRVPVIQKQIIRACNRQGVPVITATQMLESMTQSVMPTRAEVADVANAVIDGTDALMLSEETAVGAYPDITVATMAEIAVNTEASPVPLSSPQPTEIDDPVSWAVAHAGVQAATDLPAAAILCPTRSGATPRRVAAYRPPVPIVGLSSRKETLGELSLVWGVTPLPMEEVPTERDMRLEVEQVIGTAMKAGLVSEGQLVVMVAGTPGRRAGRTDFMRVVRI